MGLIDSMRFKEAKSLTRKTLPVARRVLGASHDYTLRLRACYETARYADPAATLDDLREAEATYEELERTARRVLGGAHPTTVEIEDELRGARAALSARETPAINA